MRAMVLITALMLGAAALAQGFGQPSQPGLGQPAQPTQASGFSGTFAGQAPGITITFQEGNGMLQGIYATPEGRYQLQGQTGPGWAYGVIMTNAGELGFQAQMNPDGNSIQLAFFTMGPNGQPVQQGQATMMQRVGGAVAGMPGQMPGQQPGQQPGQVPGQQPNQPPFGQPQQPPFGNPGIPAGADWNGTYTGDNGAFVLSVQRMSGMQGNDHVGYIQAQGQRYQIEAHLDDQTLHGYFQAGGTPYEFFADKTGTNVTLRIGNTSYVLQQTSAQAAP